MRYRVVIDGRVDTHFLTWDQAQRYADASRRLLIDATVIEVVDETWTVTRPPYPWGTD